MPPKMFLETIRSEGLAHLSYLVGHGGEAVVVDPRRDAEVYVRMAHDRGARITHVFETHRNEDYVIGSREVARRTGAEIHHGGATDWGYGQVVSEGDTFAVGDLELGVRETPGHTFDSISLALTDTAAGDAPVAVFTGDALFIGDVGRTDFFPDRAEEVAGLLYDSIWDKLMPLGDHVILLPAHGAGSVCGDAMAPREFSTLGHERLTNPRLQMGREAFVEHKLAENHPVPPYFKRMEAYNQEGSAPPLDRLPMPAPLDAGDFADRADGEMIVLDVRSPEAFAGAFVPGSLAVPLDMVPAYAGFFLACDTPIGLVVDDPDDVPVAVRRLVRIGYDDVVGYLGGGLHAWEVSGRDYDRIPAVHAAELSERIEAGEDFTLLDVRKQGEWDAGHVTGATHLFLGDLPARLDEVPRDRPVTTFCGSGRRALIAASILKRHGFDRVGDALGSMSACKKVGCPIET